MNKQYKIKVLMPTTDNALIKYAEEGTIINCDKIEINGDCIVFLSPFKENERSVIAVYPIRYTIIESIN